MVDSWRAIIGDHPFLAKWFFGPDGNPDEAYKAAVKRRFVQWVSDLCRRPDGRTTDMAGNPYTPTGVGEHRWSKGDSNSPSHPEHQHSEGHREFMTLNGLRLTTLNVFVGVAATSGSRPGGARVHAAAPGVLSPNRPGHDREDAEIGLGPTVAPGRSAHRGSMATFLVSTWTGRKKP
jgi:hypothetical protein